MVELTRRDVFGTNPRLAEIATELGRRDAPSPWFVQALAGFGAWVAALFLLIFMFMADLVDFKAGSMIPVGLVLLVGATLLRRKWTNAFAGQFSLAFVVAGMTLAVAGAAEGFDEAGLGAMAVALAVFAQLVSKDPVHRFISLPVAAGCVAGAVLQDSPHDWIHAIFAAEAALAGWLLLREPRPGQGALVFGTAVALLGTISLVSITEFDIEAHRWPAHLLFGASLVGVVAWALKRQGVAGAELRLTALAGAAAFGVLASPGLSAAAALAVVGLSRRDRGLVALGVAAFPLFLAAHYYDLAVPLRTKSYLLAGSGAALLGAWALLRTRPWARKEAR